VTSSVSPRDEVLQKVREYADGRLTAEDLVLHVDAALTVLELYPPEPIIDIGQAAGELLERNPEAAVSAMLQMISADGPATRAVSSAIVARLARFNPGIWAGIVRHLAADTDWEVRGFAARAYDSRQGEAGAVEFHTDWVLDELAAWAKDTDYRLRYAATQAVLGYAQGHAELVPRLLDLLDPLKSDDTEYVRHGYAMTLRILGRRQPHVVLHYIESRLPLKSDEEREVFTLTLDDSFAAWDQAKKAELLARLQS
jgi:hypothetical protein